MDLELELVFLPVADLEGAKAFYDKLDWRVDADIQGEGVFRAVHYTHTGSPASFIISNGLTDAAPCSTSGTYLPGRVYPPLATRHHAIR